MFENVWNHTEEARAAHASNSGPVIASKSNEGGSMWEDLLQIGESAWEKVGEPAEAYVSAYAESKGREAGSERERTPVTPVPANVPSNANNLTGQQPILSLSSLSDTGLMIGGAIGGAVIIGLLFFMRGN